MRRKRLGEVLHERGKISARDLEKTLEEQQQKLSHLGELLLERGLVGKADLISALEEVSLVPYVDMATTPVDPATLRLIPQEMAERLSVLPIRRDLSRLVVVMSDPRNPSALKELEAVSGMTISPRLAFHAELCEAIALHYSQLSAESTETVSVISGEAADEMEFISTSDRQANKDAIAEAQAELRSQKTPAVRLVSEIIRAAMEKHASDIHIDPRLKDTGIRMRVDGVLRDFQHVPRSLQHSLVSRIKVLADMDIAEHRNPQDGRFMISTKNRSLDLRVSTLPTQYGEKVVIRLLEPSAPLLNFTEIGFAPGIADGLQKLLTLPQGLILVTGPTGSGKSTTLYSGLNMLRKPSVNIVTVEDPVEYALPGINQVHVNTKAGLTFASALRSMLRQDPNVIMVGEIRDQETAEIALKAAQTGQLVLSTLHTNDSVSAIVRLRDLGVPPFLIASSVVGILAQRLVRKLCACHSVEPITPELSRRLSEAGLPVAGREIRVSGACGVCDRTGFKGRTAVAELLIVNEAIRAMIRGGESTDAIRELARVRGMRLMHEDGLEKVKMGVTTYDEILRIVPFEFVARCLCSSCGQQLHADFQYCPFCGERRSSNQADDSKLEREGALLP